MQIKAATARYKTFDDSGPSDGVFEAIVSVFNNVDAMGDVVLPGAFADTIAEWAASPDRLPVLWSHRMDDPMFNIGEVLELTEFAGGSKELPDWVDPFVAVNGGLWVRGRIDTDPAAGPIAQHALKVLRTRRVTQFSYAYDEIDAGPVEVNGGKAWGLKKVKLHEVSPTQVGANNLTELLLAKSTRVASRVAAQKMVCTQEEADAMASALELLQATLDAAEIEEAGSDVTVPEPESVPVGPGEIPAAGRLAGRKVGRTLSRRNEANIREAVALLDDTLKSLDEQPAGDEGKRRTVGQYMVEMANHRAELVA